ncbi:hypothetical protein [Paraburkholderia terrae]|uniref:hypothetical protein n=1 Tax=Paraburkholderia terrae TaxID=311230 RepID=UPI001EE36586|nr:hypothetical protein [Paraburkholderia terrae]GJH06190.1 hypothetical protein CBA19C8_36555 [Paraburkholderia terrae]
MAVVARSALIPSPGDWWRDFLLFGFWFLLFGFGFGFGFGFAAQAGWLACGCGGVRGLSFALASA